MSRTTDSCRHAILTALLAFAAPLAADIGAPEITAQGFDMSTAQRGAIGQFDRLRVRFEVPGRIEALSVAERSYEVDLATTPESNHLPLFGLSRQVRQLTDVTLDFGPYINRKLDEPGAYEFELTVVDRSGEHASARLLIELNSAPSGAGHREGDALQVSSFRVERVGGGTASSIEQLGFDWKTIESNQVVIRLAAPENGSFFELPGGDFDALTTQAALEATARQRPQRQELQFATAANGGAGQVFGLMSSEPLRILRITSSSTSLSEVGTTVTLEGELKH